MLQELQLFVMIDYILMKNNPKLWQIIALNTPEWEFSL